MQVSLDYDKTTKNTFHLRPHSLRLFLSHLVILSKDVLPDLRLTLTVLRCVIRSGTLLYGVPTWNTTLLRLVLGIGILLGLMQEAAFGEDYVLQFCGGKYSEVWQGKPRVAVASDQINLQVEPRLGSYASPLY